jgi:hypothetical protein
MKNITVTAHKLKELHGGIGSIQYYNTDIQKVLQYSQMKKKTTVNRFIIYTIINVWKHIETIETITSIKHTIRMQSHKNYERSYRTQYERHGKVA